MNSLQETEEQMRLLADVISKQLDGLGFALLVFEFENPGIGNYISNGRREDLIKLLRETADRFEANEVIPAIQGNA